MPNCSLVAFSCFGCCLPQTHSNKYGALPFRIWRQPTATPQHLLTTLCWCLTMRGAVPKLLAWAHLTPLSRIRTRTTTIWTSGATALRSWLICMVAARMTRGLERSPWEMQNNVAFQILPWVSKRETYPRCSLHPILPVYCVLGCHLFSKSVFYFYSARI